MSLMTTTRKTDTALHAHAGVAVWGLSEKQSEKLRDPDWDVLKGGQIMWDPQDKDWYDPQRKYGAQ
jgi:hypothetical protein